MALCRRFSGSAGIQALARTVVRSFSTAGPPGYDEPYVALSSQNSGPRTIWPDETMGPFAPQDKRFQLPGNVGFDCHLHGTGEQRAEKAQRVLPDILSAPSSRERHEFVLAQFISEYQTKDVFLPQSVSKAEKYFNRCDVECSMHSCPELLKQELESFFPALPASSITVVTVRQKRTEAETGEKRQELLDNFVNGAKEICFMLWRGGYWADFIDPLSGKAFFGAQSYDSVLQAEQRCHSGFHIEDLSSCRVIRHVVKDTPTFVGTLITSAPSNCSIMEQLSGHLINPQDSV